MPNDLYQRETNAPNYYWVMPAGGSGNVTISASTANGTPALFQGVHVRGNAANSSVAGGIAVYDGAVAAGNLIVEIPGNLTTTIGLYTSIPVPLKNGGNIVLSSVANSPAYTAFWSGGGASGWGTG